MAKKIATGASIHTNIHAFVPNTNQCPTKSVIEGNAGFSVRNMDGGSTAYAGNRCVQEEDISYAPLAKDIYIQFTFAFSGTVSSVNTGGNWSFTSGGQSFVGGNRSFTMPDNNQSPKQVVLTVPATIPVGGGSGMTNLELSVSCGSTQVKSGNVASQTASGLNINANMNQSSANANTIKFTGNMQFAVIADNLTSGATYVFPKVTITV